MQSAIDRIMLAIENKERIMIFGDYDVDGVTSSYSLFNFFQKYL
jgi:single-stranded-DNA-specific exonuclease